jgi:hypothetical protein
MGAANHLAAHSITTLKAEYFDGFVQRIARQRPVNMPATHT